MPFDGFPREGLDFLVELAEHNTRDWFSANRQRYLDHLQGPALDFVEQVGGHLQADHPDLRFSTATNGSGSLMRINRDVRFSADKSPYKTAVAGMWWLGEGKKTQRPAYGFHLEADCMYLMGGMFHFDAGQLARYRDAVLDDDLGPRLAEAVAQLESDSTLQVGGEHYKRVPRGIPADHERERLLRFSSLVVMPPTLSAEDATSARAVDLVVERLRRTRPAVDWLVDVLR